MTFHSTDQLQNTVDPKSFRTKILRWYGKHRRILPWRALPDKKPNPYHVWLSEIMLQQTTVQAVIPYFLKFIEKWPTINDLALAHNDDVMNNWAGLGYYARARNLHKCAKVIANDLGGVFPSNEIDLKNLPGIGDYTSAAITSIAFDKPSVVVDGNVERVMARIHAVEDPVPKGKVILKKYAAYYSKDFTNNTGDYAQSLMDLGATICTPKSPKCGLCPVNNYCVANKTGTQSLYPVREIKKKKPHRYGYVYWITNNNNEVLVHKRPEKGLLGGMYGFPTTNWCENKKDIVHLNLNDNDNENMKKQKESVKHVFTHFDLTLDIYTLNIKRNCFVDEYSWVDIDKVDALGFPTTFDKVRRAIL